ncbi:MAG: hypothetical protein CSB33_04630 [Desulfobacterales bacterium]|nr:MAG: hypothetical protein CSB33_04630 [Desulfobacterales bacterium]
MADLTGEKQTHKGEGHRQRLRERFLSSGLDGFQDYEVIELLLTLSTPRKDCKPPAKAALARFKSLSAVLEAPLSQLHEIPGLGPANIFPLRLIKAVADRCLREKAEASDPVKNSEDLYNYLCFHMRDQDRESFKVIYLDAKNRILGSETLFQGSLTGSAVYPREVVKSALERQAAALIFAHNHPSGDPLPSREDIAITRRLYQACRLMHIEVHEHIIVGRNRYFSFADKGYIAEMRKEYERREE